MWQWILLFIVLTPGVLFTIPPYGKKLAGGVSGKVVTAILHGVVFAAAAWFLMLCKEGFEGFQDSGVRCPEGYGCSIKIQECPAGTMGDPGRTSFTNNETLGNAEIGCTPCPEGTISVAGSYSCGTCASGQVPNSSKSACVSSSPSGTPTSQKAAQGSNRIQCQPGTGSIRSGALGFYTWGATCETCPAGTYSSPAVSNNPTTKRCTPCPPNKAYSDAGAINISRCRATQ